MNKIILSSILLLISSTSFANCSINHGGTSEIKNLIKEKKFEFEGYQKLCNRLNANDAGLMFDSVSQISPYQTTVAISISMYPKGEKYQGITAESTTWMRYSEQRTTSAQKEELYAITMHALENLASPSGEEKLKAMLLEVNDMRKATK